MREVAQDLGDRRQHLDLSITILYGWCVKHAWLLWVGLVGCGYTTMGVSPPVVGSSSDVTTMPGTYDGYRVVIPCTSHGADIGVTGTGATVLTLDADIEAAGVQLLAQLRDLDSVFGGGGAGLECEGTGTEIDLDSWLDVDQVIARTGAWLKQQNLSLQVGITVESAPVAD